MARLNDEINISKDRLKQLNDLIYEYFHINGLTECAEIFKQESGVKIDKSNISDSSTLFIWYSNFLKEANIRKSLKSIHNIDQIETMTIDKVKFNNDEIKVLDESLQELEKEKRRFKELYKSLNYQIICENESKQIQKSSLKIEFEKNLKIPVFNEVEMIDDYLITLSENCICITNLNDDCKNYLGYSKEKMREMSSFNCNNIIYVGAVSDDSFIKIFALTEGNLLCRNVISTRKKILKIILINGLVFVLSSDSIVSIYTIDGTLIK
ncbi:hypothetical protein HERIO_881 [Hepatospora eriocheir]|uniref:Uncharacterized protein n=1 Tax=Hepatospora eriocheir TaxID=1081669 RepID=A0A1X0QBQ2_9MICR|nr:hypothetical protein HERIO_881 [Hepatospora eriocheir]